MDGRQVDDVEAELGELGQHPLDAREPAPRARKQLVPGAEAGALAIDVHLERPCERRRLGAVGVLPGEALLDGERRDAVQERPLRELAGQVLLPRVDLPRDLVPPGREPVDPGLDGELPPTALVHLEGTRPAVVPQRLERRLAPPPRARTAVADRRAEQLVAVAEDRRRHVDAVADGRLDRVAPAVDLRRHVLDQDPPGCFLRLRRGHSRFTVSDDRAI
jgi:hypothetical protein